MEQRPVFSVGELTQYVKNRLEMDPTLQSLQVQGAEAGQLVGLVELTLGAHRVLVRQPLDTLQQGPAALHVHKVLTFRGGKRLERAA